MKKINFLIKLRLEEKLKITEPSEAIKKSYQQKSENSLKSAQILLQNNQIEDAVPLAYYSMYNMLTALLFKVGIKCENHSACIIILKELFGVDDSKISFAKTERIDKQYYADFKIGRREAEEMIVMAREFNSKLYDFIEKMTTRQTIDFLEEFQKALK